MQLRSQMISAEAWAAACNRASGMPGLGTDPVDEWAATGWLDSAGNLDSRVQSLLRSHLDAKVSLQVSSVYRDLQYLTQVSVGFEGIVTSSTTRFRTRELSAFESELIGADPQIEFVVGEGNDPWPLISRVLPPLDALRAAPKETPPHRVKRISLDLEAKERAHRVLTESSWADSDALITALRQEGVSLPEIRAAVQLVFRVRTADSLRISSETWLAGDDLFHTFNEGGEPQIECVEPGDLGFQILWMMLGAIGKLSTGVSA